MSPSGAKLTVKFKRLNVAGESLPAIRHISDMKMKDDTLLFVYECNDGYGQRIMRRAILNPSTCELSIGHELGKRANGYYVSYMPFPFIAVDGSLRVISQDNGEIYQIENDTTLVSMKQNLIGDNSVIPFAISHYVQDLFMAATDLYVFRGREPNGGRQFVMTANVATQKIDSILQLSITPKLQNWMPNTGEMACSPKNRRIVFAYRLHPIIEFFDMNGKTIKTVRLGADTFNPATINDADFEDLNPLHTVDITYTPDHLYVLYWGYRFSESDNSRPTIFKLVWNGNIIDSYANLPKPIRKIAAIDDNCLIGWSGNNFFLIQLNAK